MYFNLEVLKRKVENEIPPFLRNDDVLNYFPEGSGSYGKDVMRGLRFNIMGRFSQRFGSRSMTRMVVGKD